MNKVLRWVTLIIVTIGLIMIVDTRQRILYPVCAECGDQLTTADAE